MLPDKNEIIRDLIDWSIERYDSSVNGNYKLANKLYKKITKLYYDLIKYGDEYIKILEDLTEHQDDRVKYTAATYLVNIKPPKALPILNELSKKEGTIGTECKLALEMYEKHGRMEFKI